MNHCASESEKNNVTTIIMVYFGIIPNYIKEIMANGSHLEN